eukprot:5019070-Pyramimonas_sp.AAC.1
MSFLSRRIAVFFGDPYIEPEAERERRLEDIARATSSARASAPAIARRSSAPPSQHYAGTSDRRGDRDPERVMHRASTTSVRTS